VCLLLLLDGRNVWYVVIYVPVIAICYTKTKKKNRERERERDRDICSLHFLILVHLVSLERAYCYCVKYKTGAVFLTKAAQLLWWSQSH